MRAISVLLGVCLSATVTAALAEMVISKECDLLARGTRGSSDEVLVGAWCPGNLDWVPPKENTEATIEWSRQSRVLQRVQSGDRVAIPDEHRCFSYLGVDPKAFPWFKPIPCKRGEANVVSDAHLVREERPSPSPEIVRKLTSAPQFEDFTVRSIYKGKRARPRLTTDFARLFRTRLRNGAKEEPNFAGHYRLVFWGCGTNCLSGGVVNARTGTVTPIPRSLVFTGLCWNAKVSSRLFIVAERGDPSNERPDTFYFYHIMRDSFHLIGSVDGTTEVLRQELCGMGVPSFPSVHGF